MEMKEISKGVEDIKNDSPWGIAAFTFSSFAILGQLRMDNADDFSAVFIASLLLAQTCWIVYGAVREAPFVILNSSVWLVLAFRLLYLKYIKKRLYPKKK